MNEWENMNIREIGTINSREREIQSYLDAHTTRDSRRPSAGCTWSRGTCNSTEDTAAAGDDAGDGDDARVAEDPAATAWNGREDNGTCRLYRPSSRHTCRSRRTARSGIALQSTTQRIYYALVIRRTVLHDLSVLAIRRTMQINSRPTEIIYCYSIRPRSHNFELTHNQDNRNFIDRMLLRNPCM